MLRVQENNYIKKRAGNYASKESQVHEDNCESESMHPR
jgi:hypothetical protein